MRNRPLCFTLAISTIIVGGGFVRSGASARAAQGEAVDSLAKPAPVVAQHQLEPTVGWRMIDLERRARIDMILYQGQFGQPNPVPGHRLDAVALTVIQNAK